MLYSDQLDFSCVFNISLPPSCAAFPDSPSFHPSILMQESIRGVDEALARYDRDIHIMNHRPRRGGKVPTHNTSGMSQKEKQKLQVPCYDDVSTYHSSCTCISTSLGIFESQ